MKLFRWADIPGILIIALFAFLAVTRRLTIEEGHLVNFEPFPLPMESVAVPTGEFPIGSDNGDPDERLMHAVYLDTFEIGMYDIK